MLNALIKYDHSMLSVPHHSHDIFPQFQKLVRTESGTVLTCEKIMDIQLRKTYSLYLENHRLTKLEDTAVFKFIAKQINRITGENEITRYLHDRQNTKLFGLLEKSYLNINARTEIPVFGLNYAMTPWSAPSHTHRLYLLGWEKKQSAMPLLVDFYHSVFYAQAFSYKTNRYHEVHSVLKGLEKNSNYQAIITRFGVNTALHLKIYLLYALSFYLRQLQTSESAALKNLIRIWREALSQTK